MYIHWKVAKCVLDNIDILTILRRTVQFTWDTTQDIVIFIVTSAGTFATKSWRGSPLSALLTHVSLYSTAGQKSIDIPLSERLVTVFCRAPGPRFRTLLCKNLRPFFLGFRLPRTFFSFFFFWNLTARGTASSSLPDSPTFAGWRVKE